LLYVVAENWKELKEGLSTCASFQEVSDIDLPGRPSLSTPSVVTGKYFSNLIISFSCKMVSILFSARHWKFYIYESFDNFPKHFYNTFIWPLLAKSSLCLRPSLLISRNESSRNPIFDNRRTQSLKLLLSAKKVLK